MFEIELTEDHTAVFRLKNDVRMGQAAELRRLFWECIHEKQIRRLIIDLSQVPVLDPSVISLFVATKNVVSKKKGELILAGVSPRSRQFLERTHLDHYFDLVPSVTEALKQPLSA